MTVSRPWRIALDCRYIGPRPSGIGEFVAALVQHLPPLAPDCEFTFLRHTRAAGPLSAAANVREIEVGAAANGPVTLLHLPLAVDLAGIDLFHAPANILPGGLAMPTITTIHDVMWLTNGAIPAFGGASSGPFIPKALPGRWTDRHRSRQLAWPAALRFSLRCLRLVGGSA
jgi:hypothetical protein